MRKGKYSMHARLFENYENGMILAQASKQASKQTYKLSLSFLRASKPNIIRNQDFFCLAFS